MIVAFEGLSCAGKSELIGALRADYPVEYAVVPELIMDTTHGIDTYLCQVNDLAKSQMAELLQATRPNVLVDRTFLSTEAYAYAEGVEDAQALEAWYVDKWEDGALLLPDLFVYLRLSPAEAMSRAHQIGRASQPFAWYTAPERAYAYYEEYFSMPHYCVDTLTVNAEKPTAELVPIIHKAITQGRAKHEG